MCSYHRRPLATLNCRSIAHGTAHEAWIWSSIGCELPDNLRTRRTRATSPIQLMPRPRTTTVRDLANEADLDLDEALVTLGTRASTRLRTKDQPFRPDTSDGRAKWHWVIEDDRAVLAVDYWLQLSGLQLREELAARLTEVGMILNPDVRKIPKNSLRRLRSNVDSRRFDGCQRPAPAIDVAPSAPLRWRTIGNSPIRRYLREEEIEAIHEALTEAFLESGDPIFPPGVRDYDLLSSASHRPFTSIGDHLKYPTLEMASAALFHSVVQNHAFHNGNKRTGLVSLLAMLDENDRVLTCSEQDLFRFTLLVAQHGLGRFV